MKYENCIFLFPCGSAGLKFRLLLPRRASHCYAVAELVHGLLRCSGVQLAPVLFCFVLSTSVQSALVQRRGKNAGKAAVQFFSFPSPHTSAPPIFSDFLRFFLRVSECV